MITVTRIHDLAGLKALAPEWSALVERDPCASPFQRPEWMIPWWKWFGSGELHGLAFRCNGRLTGFLPFFIHPWKGRQQATLAGTGISDRLGLLAEQPLADHCARQAWAYLEDLPEWDVCDWQDLAADSILAAHAPEWLRFEDVPSTPWMRTALPATVAQYDSSLSSELRRDLRRFTRKLERDGELRFETVTNDVWLLGDLFELHTRRWAHKGGPASKVDQAGTQQFLWETVRLFAAAGKLRLYVMWYRGAAAGMILAFMDQGAVWDLVTGMDPALMRYSPGSLLLKYAIGDALREGARGWDFLRGDEFYKLRWGARPAPTKRLKIENRFDTQAPALPRGLTLPGDQAAP